jgi:hypothetical protein
VIALGILLALLAVAAILSIVWQPGSRLVGTDAGAPAASAPATGPPASRDSEPARYPLAAGNEAQPALDMSDATLIAGLGAVFGDGALSAYLEPNNVVRRIVATVDNLPRRSAPPAKWPLKPAAGALATTTTDGRTTIAEANAFRYAPYVRLLESVNTERLVALYQRHYALFQQAYRELGYPNGHFNDRVVEAIDVVMAAPSLDREPRLKQPKVFMEFADRDLEQLPAGQKIMLRIGSANATRVRAKLAEIRAAITDPAAIAAR